MREAEDAQIEIPRQFDGILTGIPQVTVKSTATVPNFRYLWNNFVSPAIR